MTNQLIYTGFDTTTIASPPQSIPRNDAPRPGHWSGRAPPQLALAGFGLVAVATFGVAVVADVPSQRAEPAPPQRSDSATVQAEIDAALADLAGTASKPQLPAAVVIQNENDAALTERTGSSRG